MSAPFEHKETDPLPPRGEDDIRPHHCTTCGEKGHNARTCGQTPEERKARRHRGRK